MKINVENLGVLKRAEFELGDITLICGGNNTGKTYATYALFGFLHRWNHYLRDSIPNQKIYELLNHGITRIDIKPYIEKANETLKSGCQRYTQSLPRIFASKPIHFNNSRFQVELERDKLQIAIERAFERKVGTAKSEIFSFSKAKGENNLVISLFFDKDETPLPFRLIKYVILGSINDMIFGPHFPRPFIASAERTGGAIFRGELSGVSGVENLPWILEDSGPSDYALPIRVNIDFIRKLENVVKEDSFIAKEHPQILNDFSDIIGGEYIAGDNDTIYFQPSREKTNLTMGESSSAVRSLLNIGFYLRNSAKRGDLLMVDEPELNLHPENQRRIARLFARLVNLGIKVFITTHSDYIVKELNTLIMLNHDKPHLKQIAEQEGYDQSEFITAEKIKMYIAEKSRDQSENYQTLVKARVDPELGIEARSFDETINKMNEIQEAIVWGADE